MKQLSLNWGKGLTVVLQYSDCTPHSPVGIFHTNYGSWQFAYQWSWNWSFGSLLWKGICLDRYPTEETCSELRLKKSVGWVMNFSLWKCNLQMMWINFLGNKAPTQDINGGLMVDNLVPPTQYCCSYGAKATEHLSDSIWWPENEITLSKSGCQNLALLFYCCSSFKVISKTKQPILYCHLHQHTLCECSYTFLSVDRFFFSEMVIKCSPTSESGWLEEIGFNRFICPKGLGAH